MKVGYFDYLSNFQFTRTAPETYKSGLKISGGYKIDPDGLGEFEVYCDQKTAGGGWTVFQKRRDSSVDFYRGWDACKRGFGNLTGEFLLGLDKIYRPTVSSSYKLRVDLEDVPGKTAFAEYSSFGVASERAKYQLSLGSYSFAHFNLSKTGNCEGAGRQSSRRNDTYETLNKIFKKNLIHKFNFAWIAGRYRQN